MSDSKIKVDLTLYLFVMPVAPYFTSNMTIKRSFFALQNLLSLRLWVKIPKSQKCDIILVVVSVLLAPHNL